MSRAFRYIVAFVITVAFMVACGSLRFTQEVEYKGRAAYKFQHVDTVYIDTCLTDTTIKK